MHEGPVGKVALLQNGKVSFNGQAVSIEKLRAKLAELKKQDGTVWYYRETPQGEPPAIFTQVLEAIIENQLPVSLSTEPDFSTAVLPDGTVRPRW